MELTIYNVYVNMESQEQYDRMKQICIDNGLPYEKDDGDFIFEKYQPYVFRYSPSFKTFCDWMFDSNLHFTEITEQEFLKLII